MYKIRQSFYTICENHLHKQGKERGLCKPKEKIYGLLFCEKLVYRRRLKLLSGLINHRSEMRQVNGIGDILGFNAKPVQVMIVRAVFAYHRIFHMRRRV